MKPHLKENVNYAAQFVELKLFQPIANRDRIQHAIINGNFVIVSSECKVGDRGIYFPVESKIDGTFLTLHNLYRDKSYNDNKEKSGFFGDSGRVIALKLGTAISEGFFVKETDLHSDYKLDYKVGEFFDYIGNKKLVEKYIVKLSRLSMPSAKCPKTNRHRHQRFIENQINLHYSTPKLGDHSHHINPNDIISITNKLHGASAVFSKTLILKKLGWCSKLLLKLGFPIIEQEYGYIRCSRKVVKNGYLYNMSCLTSLYHYGVKQLNHKFKKFGINILNNLYDKTISDQEGFKFSTGFYNTDVWGQMAEKYNHCLQNGMTVYGEIVGTTQKNYTYGLKANENELYVYRITLTSSDGFVHEYSAFQVENYCEKHGLKYMPKYYYGKAGDLFPELLQEPNFGEKFVLKLRNSFNMEKDCELCNNTQPAEGIVLRNDSKIELPALKLRTFRFLKKESDEKTLGEITIEEVE